MALLSSICTTLLITLILSVYGAERRVPQFDFGPTTTTAEILMETGSFLRGKLAIVTGPTSGLGKETVRSLAIVDCKVIMAARDLEKAQKVKQELIETILNDRSRKTIQKSLERNLIPMQLDLGSLQSILDFAKEFYREFQQPLNYLFNNAGIMAVPEYTVTTDGYEQQIGVNHLGHYYLSRLLTNKLTQTDHKKDVPGRVITVSSRAHKLASDPIDTAITLMEEAVFNPKALKLGYEGYRFYGISKAFNILFARELERREGHRGVISMSLHPGVIQSGLQQFLAEDVAKNKQYDKNIEQGTATQIWLALAPYDILVPGGYYDDCQFHDDRLREDIKPTEGYLEDEFDATNTAEYKLWEASEQLILKKGFSFEFTVRFKKQKKNKDKEDL